MKQTNKTFVKIMSATMLALMLTATSNLIGSALAQNPVADGAQNQVAMATDTELPSDVENLASTPGDGSVLLMWDRATDNVGVTGYKIYRGTRSITTDGDIYDLPVIPVGNVTSYAVKNLSNGNTYYFAVTAVDAANNESNNYSYEASAKPESGLSYAAGEDDGASPQVAEVKTENNSTVSVVFSEAVKLPPEEPVSSFKIQKVADMAALEIKNAKIDDNDNTGKTVLLTTATQTADAEYVLTAGIEIQDLAGNPIISGTSDTGSFRGSAVPTPALIAAEEMEPRPAAPAIPPPDEVAATDNEVTEDAAIADTEAPTITSGTADFNNRIAIEFSEKIILPENAKTEFKINKKGTTENLPIVNVSLSVDGKTIYITTAMQQAVEYDVKLAGVTDAAGNELSEENSATEVTGKGSSIEDLVPPENVTALIAKLKDAKKNIVELSWKPSKNSAGDLAEQFLYQSSGKNEKKFGEGAELGDKTSTIEVEDLEGGKWYTFKVTAKDTGGNENSGAITSIFLPQTGPGMVAAGLTALLMGVYRKRKNGEK